MTVDNQPPSPVIVSPVNGNGAYGANQTFTVRFASPHPNLDFSYGQIVFAGPSSTCVAQWTLAGSIAPENQGNGAASPCTLANALSAVSNNGTNQVTVTIALAFPPAWQAVVQAFGADAQGIAGPLTTLTKFTVTGTPQPQLLSSATQAVIPVGGVTQLTQTIVLVNGATGPVTAGTPTIYQPPPGYPQLSFFKICRESDGGRLRRFLYFWISPGAQRAAQAAIIGAERTGSTRTVETASRSSGLAKFPTRADLLKTPPQRR